jgi:integrase/recombinase XerD
MSFTPLTPQTGFALEVFLLDAQARNLSPRTLRYYRQQIGWFADYLVCHDCHQLDQISPHHIRAYLLYLQEQKRWKSASVHSAARAIRAFFNFCVAEQLASTSPMARVKMPKTTEHLLPAYSEQEVRSLLDAAKTQRDRALILCLLDSGCRANEFLAWNVGDVNLATGTVCVRHTKNRHERTTYLGIRTRRELIKLYGTQSTAPDDPVWCTLDTGRRLQYEGLKTLLQKLGKAARVYPCSPHRFRRTFALLSLRNGMNVYALQRIMGHADLSVLRRYLALLDDDLRDAHQRFGAVDHMLK